MTIRQRIVAVADQQALRVHRRGVFEPLFKTLRAVLVFPALVVGDRVNLVELVNILVRCSRRAEHHQVSLLAGIRNLLHAAAVDLVALLLERAKRLRHLLAGDAKLTVNAGADVDHALFGNLLAKKIRRCLSGGCAGGGALIQERAQRGFRNIHFAGDLCRALALGQHGACAADAGGTAGVDGAGIFGAKLGGASEVHGGNNIAFAHTRLAKLLHAAGKVAAVLVRLGAAPQRVTAGTSSGCAIQRPDAIVHQNLIGNPHIDQPSSSLRTWLITLSSSIILFMTGRSSSASGLWNSTSSFW